MPEGEQNRQDEIQLLGAGSDHTLLEFFWQDRGAFSECVKRTRAVIDHSRALLDRIERDGK